MRLGRLGHLIALAALTFGLTPANAAHAASLPPHVGPPSAFDAPAGKPGGTMNPNATCGKSYSVTPRMRWRVENHATGEVVCFDWLDAHPGMHFPRLAVGTHTSEVTVRCRSKVATRTHQFTIRRKTVKSTISVPEFRRVKVGMTRQRVRHIVGNGGVAPDSYDGNTARTFHLVRFWA